MSISKQALIDYARERLQAQNIYQAATDHITRATTPEQIVECDIALIRARENWKHWDRLYQQLLADYLAQGETSDDFKKAVRAAI